MPTGEEIVLQLRSTKDWNARIALIRTIPEAYGTRDHAHIYGRVAWLIYVPHIKADFGYVHWREEYTLPVIQAAYDEAARLTAGFSMVERSAIQRALVERPETLRIFRLLLGLTVQEFAEACAQAREHEPGLTPVSRSAIERMESGKQSTEFKAFACAVTIDLGMNGNLFPATAGDALRSKLDKPDTQAGWQSVRTFARHGVPLSILLHQRAYGGAFRQLLDATGSKRGDALEDPVEALFREHRIPYVRTGAHDQQAIQREFGLTVRPAPDFVIHGHRPRVLKAILECKAASDGGTARDKASRFGRLRQEANRLGGIPVFAVLSGAGWKRVRDALGPVIRDTDGRVFSPATLPEMVEVEPLRSLVATRSKAD